MLHFQYGSSFATKGWELGMDMTFRRTPRQSVNLWYIFCNKKLVSNIWCAPESLTLKSNGGELIVSHIVDVFDYYNELVWFSKQAIANIFPLKNMTKQYKVTYNSKEESFLVHREALRPHN